VDSPYEIKPKEFARFAELDLNVKDKRALANAIGNIKRCIECQIDSLLYAFGFGDLSLRSDWSFPKKVEALKELRIVTPRILERINKSRNLFEHTYKLPRRRQVEDALDVAVLSVAYTERLLESYSRDLELVLMGPDLTIGRFGLDIEKGRLTVRLIHSKTKFEVNPNQKEYTRILAVLLERGKM
jgi:hypothetical protein